MTFGEAWKAMEQGKKVCIPRYKDSVIYLKDNHIILHDLVNQNEYRLLIDKFEDDIFSDEWEIYTNPSDYKFFMDKNKNFYINGQKVESVISANVTYERGIGRAMMELKFFIDRKDLFCES